VHANVYQLPLAPWSGESLYLTSIFCFVILQEKTTDTHQYTSPHPIGPALELSKCIEPCVPEPDGRIDVGFLLSTMFNIIFIYKQLNYGEINFFLRQFLEFSPLHCPTQL
jgi:hypothetical protein